jgi:transcriptional regulator with XRE-family HTH domain
MDIEKIGKIIKEARVSKGMTQIELSKILMVSDKAISKWERGICCPDISLLIPISEALNIDLYELLGSKNIGDKSLENAMKQVIKLSDNEIKNKNQKFMKKNVLISSLVIALLLIGIYFAYKAVNLTYYSIDSMSVDDYNKIVAGLKVNGTMTIKTTTLEDNDYLTHKNIKIRNDFKDFEFKDNNDNRSVTYYTTDEATDQTKGIILSINETYIELLESSNIELYAESEERINNLNNNLSIKNYLEKNNINSDIELFEFISNQKLKKINIFTSVKEMKENYKKYFITTVAFPLIRDITLINGDYNGYIFNIGNNIGIKEVSIIKDNKRYTLTFINTKYFTNEYVNELLNTVIIE